MTVLCLPVLARPFHSSVCSSPFLRGSLTEYGVLASLLRTAAASVQGVVAAPCARSTCILMMMCKGGHKKVLKEVWRKDKRDCTVHVNVSDESLVRRSILLICIE